MPSLAMRWEIPASDEKMEGLKVLVSIKASRLMGFGGRHSHTSWLERRSCLFPAGAFPRSPSYLVREIWKTLLSCFETLHGIGELLQKKG